MKNFSLILMGLAALSINVSSAQAVNKQVRISANNESHSEGHKITNSTNVDCYWIGPRLYCK